MSGSNAPSPHCSHSETCDVIGGGGGPAGATAAAALARLGRSVVLVEKGRRRSRRVESAGPALLTLLQAVGAKGRVETAGALEPCSNVVLWVQSDSASAEKSRLLIDRDAFDRAMLQTAAEAGVKILKPASAGRPRRDS